MAALCDPRSAHRAEELRVGNANKRSTTHFFSCITSDEFAPPPRFRAPPPHTDAVYGNNAVKALHTMPSLITQRSLRRGWRRRECKLC